MSEKELKTRKLFMRKVIICVCIIAAAAIAIALYADYLTKPKTITTIGSETQEETVSEISIGGCSEKPLYLLGTYDDVKEYTHGEIIDMEYTVVDVVGASRIEASIIAPDGVELLSEKEYEISEKDAVIPIEAVLSDDFFTDELVITLTAYDEKNEMLASYCKRVYMLHEEDHDYVTDICYDELAPYSPRIEEELRALDLEGEEIYYEEESSELLERGTYEVKGTIKWKDKNGTVHPARNIRVEIYHDGINDPVVATTNSSGYYDKTWTSSATAEYPVCHR